MVGKDLLLIPTPVNFFFLACANHDKYILEAIGSGQSLRAAYIPHSPARQSKVPEKLLKGVSCISNAALPYPVLPVRALAATNGDTSSGACRGLGSWNSSKPSHNMSST